MKKILTFGVLMVMAITLVATAFASTPNSAVSGTLTSTTVYVRVTDYVDKAANKSWNAPFYGASDYQRVVVRVYQKGNTESAVSATWVYSDYSTTSHSYKASFQSAFKAFLGAKVDDRDEGPITVSGNFHSSI